MKKVFLIAVLLLTYVFVSFGQKVKLNDMTFSITKESKVILLNGNDAKGKIEIPESLNYNNTNYPVVEIGQSAFKNNLNITEVKIPNSISIIDKSAFFGCENLSLINMPNSVQSIGKDCFSNSRQLYIILNDIFPASLTLDKISGVKGFYIPNDNSTDFIQKLKEIGFEFHDGAASNVINYEKLLYYDNDNMSCLFLQLPNNQSSLIKCYAKNGSKNIRIPDSFVDFTCLYIPIDEMDYKSIYGGGIELNISRIIGKGDIYRQRIHNEMIMSSINSYFYTDSTIDSICVANEIYNDVIKSIPDNSKIKIYTESKLKSKKIDSEIPGKIDKVILNSDFDITSLKINGALNYNDLDYIALNMKFLTDLDISDCRIIKPDYSLNNKIISDYDNERVIENVHSDNYVKSTIKTNNGQMYIENLGLFYNLKKIKTGKDLEFLKYYPFKSIENLEIQNGSNTDELRYLDFPNLKTVCVVSDSLIVNFGLNIPSESNKAYMDKFSGYICTELLNSLLAIKGINNQNQFKMHFNYKNKSFNTANSDLNEIVGILKRQVYANSYKDVINKIDNNLIDENTLKNKCSYGFSGFDNFLSLLDKNIWSYYSEKFSEYNSPLKKEYFMKSKEYKECDSIFNSIVNSFNHTLFYFKIYPSSSYDMKSENQIFKTSNISCTFGADEDYIARPQKCLSFFSHPVRSDHNSTEFIYVESLPLKVIENYCNGWSGHRKSGITQLSVPMSKDIAYEIESKNTSIYIVLPDEIKTGNYYNTNLTYWFDKNSDLSKSYIDDYYKNYILGPNFSHIFTHPTQFFKTKNAYLLIFDDLGKLLFKKKYVVNNQ